jgi:hypothetical protein
VEENLCLGPITDTVETLILDLLEWVGQKDPTYLETMGRLAHVESRQRGHYCSVISTSIIPVSAASGCKALPTTAPTSRLRSVPFIA